MQPFSGLKVIDCASFVAGPAAATILGDFGAQVIKVEPPEGDPYRTLVPDGSYPWDLDSRNKRSLAIDLKHPDGLAALYRLVAQADVFITNYPKPVRRRLKIDAETLTQLNPQLIYASLTAFGEAGPEADKTGFDTTAYWGRSGLMDMVKPDHEAPPSRSVIGMGDHPTSMTMYAAIATALFQRERTGQGGVVSTSLLANGLWANSVMAQAAIDGIDIPPRLPREKAPNPLSNVYRCRDGRWINLAVLNDRQFAPLCELLGCEDLARDPGLAQQAGRFERHAELIARFDACFAQRDRDDWRDRLDRAGITFAVISTVQDLPGDEQLKASGVLVPFADGLGLTVSSPFELGGVRKVAPVRAPARVGQHADAVLQDAGYSQADIDRLRHNGVLPS